MIDEIEDVHRLSHVTSKGFAKGFNAWVKLLCRVFLDDYIIRNSGFCNCRLQLKFSCM